jgi:hypothetical protein
VNAIRNPDRFISQRTSLPVNANRGKAGLTLEELSFRSSVRFQALFGLSRSATVPFPMEATMHGIIYLIGLVVVILFLLSLLGLR